ncbi:hypothetical protein RB595_001845 [Gaeumannomyces hyphopodioides]
MAEYWKSTPRYWCKHCSMYVRDTKLDRANHEATGKHRGGVERALRDLHRGHERDEREKERARREIERLNGVVGGPSSSSSSADAGASKLRTGPPPPPPPPQPQQQGGAAGLSKEQRQTQLEQLLAMGVSIPEELRADMAMAGDWTVTKVRVVDGDGDGTGAKTADTAGVRGKRERDKTEDEIEAEEAAEGLFKRPKRWGRGDSKAGGGEDAELEALLGGDVAIKKTEEGDGGGEKTAVKKEDEGGVKKEDGAAAAPVKKEEQPADVAPVKDEPRDEDGGIGESVSGDVGAAPAVMFKKRKPKNTRQR